MNSITAVVGNVLERLDWQCCAQRGRIDDSIKGATAANPRIDLVAHFGFCVVPTGIGGNGRNVVARHGW